MNLVWAKRGMLKQALLQVGKVPIRVSGGGHALVDLKYMHARPRDIFLSERP